MPDATHHGKVVLAGILAFRGTEDTRTLDFAVPRVPEEYFADRVQRELYLIIQRFANQAGGIITRAQLEENISRASPEPGRALMYGEAYDAVLPHKPSSMAEFKHSVTQLRELYLTRASGEILAEGMHILRQGAEDGKRKLYGHADAREYVIAELSALDRESAAQGFPEGDVRREEQEVLAAYAAAQQARIQGMAQGILTGIPELDKLLKGSFLRPGQFGIVAGYTSAGKTAFCCQLAWDVSVNQRKDVVYFTTETLRSQVRTKLVARHSRLPQFGLPKGLNTRDITEGTLDEREVAAFQAVLRDFRENPDYGHCYVAQVPRGATVPVIEAKMTAVARQFHVDLVIMDYLQLWKPARPRKDRREELAEIVMETKQVASTFADGAGAAILSPWQVSRAGREAAKANGGAYTYEALAETAESVNTADILLTLFDPENDTSMGRNVPLDLDILKNRDGERGGRLKLTADFANATFAARDRMVSETSLFGG